jgi:hypothetical protein
MSSTRLHLFLLIALATAIAVSGCRSRRTTTPFDGGVVRVDGAMPPRDGGPIGPPSDGAIVFPDSGPTSCAVRSTGSSVGLGVFSGTTSGVSVHGGSCGGSSAPEAIHDWTAPSSGAFTIDLEGSSYDTLLYVYGGSCPGEELACDDDGGTGTISLVTVSATAGQHLYIVVDGFSSNMGSYTVNIAAVAP